MPVLLVSGQRQRFADEPGAAIRTALGFDAAGRKMWFVVVDGRQAGYSKGITLPELTSLFVELGAVDAINLDGGGSSTCAWHHRGRRVAREQTDPYGHSGTRASRRQSHRPARRRPALMVAAKSLSRIATCCASLLLPAPLAMGWCHGALRPLIACGGNEIRVYEVGAEHAERTWQGSAHDEHGLPERSRPGC